MRYVLYLWSNMVSVECLFLAYRLEQQLRKSKWSIPLGTEFKRRRLSAD